MEKINILGVNINRITKKQAIESIANFLFDGKQHYIVTTNPEFLMAAAKDGEFKKILNEADLSVPDGIGLLWAATVENPKSEIRNPKLLKKFKILMRGIFCGLALLIYPKFCQKVLPERVAGVDLVWEIVRLAEQKKCSIFFLGGMKDVAMAAALKLKQKFPNLKVVGAEIGLTTYNLRLTTENAELISRINKAKPDILLVAFGQVKQEKWIYYNLKKLPSVKLAIGVGGSFDVISGAVRRAPKIFQKLGLEWFWRVMCQPWRINRIITATFRFANGVINDKIKTG